MKKVGEFLKKHKKLVIFLVIVVVLIVAIGTFVSKVKKVTEEMLSSTQGTVEKIERRSIVDSLSATGTVVSIDSFDIIPKVNNVEVKEVLVSIGDVVKAGDVICVLDSTNLERSRDNAEITQDVTGSKANSNVAIAKRNLSESFENEAIQVDRDFEDADKLYEKYQNALKDIDKAQAEYDAAVNYYGFRVKEYEDYKSEHEDLDEFQFLNQTERGSYYKGNMTSAENDMRSKENTLQSKKDAAKAALDNYENQLRAYEDHVRNNDSNIMSRNDSLTSAKLDTKTANLNNEQQINQYNEQIEACTVTAPIAGVVTALNVYEGGMYAGNAIAVIEDNSSYEVTTQIDEYDISKIKVGQRVVIKTNGTGDLELEGKVKEIAPRSTKSTGTNNVATSVTYKVTISVLTPCDDLKMDMTAKLSIIINSKEDVLTVPYDAVQTDGEGRFFIEKATEVAPSKDGKMSDEEIQNAANRLVGVGPDEANKIYVTKGIESDYYIEVIGDGVEEGLDIVVPKAEGLNDFMTMLQEQGAMGGF